MTRNAAPLDDDGLPYMPLWVAKYEGRTAHLTLEEDGAYTRLLRLCWKTPGCTLPADPAWIARMMRVDSATYDRVVAPILEEFWEQQGAGSRARFCQPTLLKIWMRQTVLHQRRQEAGSRGGKARAQNLKEKDVSNTTSKAGSKPPSKTQESQSHIHIASSEAIRARALAVCGHGLVDRDLSPGRDWGIDEALTDWHQLGASDDLIVEVIKARTAEARPTPLRSLKALTPHIREALNPTPSANGSAPANSVQAEVPPPVLPPDGPARELAVAVLERKGPAWWNAWMVNATIGHEEISVKSAFYLYKLQSEIGRELRAHGFTLTVKEDA